MPTNTWSFDGRWPRPSWRGILLGTLLVNTELAAVVAYFLFTDARLTSPQFTLYGLIWLNVGLLVLARLRVPQAERGTRRWAAAVGIGYFLLLAVVGGVVGPAGEAAPPGVDVALLPPGWGPALTLNVAGVGAVLMPAKVVGYAALAALVYTAVLDLSGTGGIAGILGVFSCISCTFPVVASVVGSLFGSGAPLVAASVAAPYGTSTLVFLVTVGVLWWRPTGG